MKDYTVTGLFGFSMVIYFYILQDPPEDAVVATCGHVFCYQCVHDSLTGDAHVCPYPFCGKKLSVRSVFTPAVLKLSILPKLEIDQKTSCSTVDDKASSICDSSYISSKIREAVGILKSIIKTRAITMGDATESIPSEEAPVKTIVFSQWTGMLDLMELSLNSNNIQFRRLDGSMCLNLREKGVNEFQTDPEVLAFYPLSSSTVCLYLTHIFLIIFFIL